MTFGKLKQLSPEIGSRSNEAESGQNLKAPQSCATKGVGQEGLEALMVQAKNHLEEVDLLLAAFERSNHSGSFYSVSGEEINPSRLYQASLAIARRYERSTKGLDAEDLVQELAAKLFETKDAYSGPKLYNWVLKVLTNLCIDKTRAAGRKQEVQVSGTVAGEDDTTVEEEQISRLVAKEGGGDFSEAVDAKLSLQRAMPFLEQEMKDALYEVYVTETSVDQASKKLGIGRDALDSRLLRARQIFMVALNVRLRDCIAKLSGMSKQVMERWFSVPPPGKAAIMSELGIVESAFATVFGKSLNALVECCK